MSSNGGTDSAGHAIHTWQVGIDQAQRLVTLDGDSQTVTQTYDARGRPETVSEATVGTFTYGYDQAGRTATLTRPSGAVTTTTYNASQHRQGHVSRYPPSNRRSRPMHDNATRPDNDAPCAGFTCGARRAVLVGLVLLAGCPKPQPASAEAEPLAPAVDELLAAFNRHDPEAMAARVAPDVQWYAVQGDEISVEASGRAALVEGMAGYFEAFPTVASTIERSMTSAPYVTTWERVSWTGQDGTRHSQAALADYELRDDVVQNVWYYPAVP